jgi:hypothetical protein
MRIDGIVTCVGNRYAEILKKAIPIWRDTLDSVTVVTDDPTIINLPVGVRTFTTTLFKEYGAFFNKGAALSSAYAWLNPTDWVLHFDADVIPPPNWREIAEPLIEVGNLYGAVRTYQDGRLISDPGPPFPYAFFHLWNVRDRSSWIRPLWDLFWPSAGHYEVSFLDRWPDGNRIGLPIKLVHPCEPREGWFGESAEGVKHMREDARLGHVMPRVKKMFVLKVPDFKTQIFFTTKDPSIALEIMSKNTTTNPFLTYVKAVDKVEMD